MIRIHNTENCSLIDTPELYREVSSYLMYCQHELHEYADEDDPEDQGLNFSVWSEEDLPMLEDLGQPEEVVRISIQMDGMVQTIYRIVYVTEVVFIPAEISHLISF